MNKFTAAENMAFFLLEKKGSIHGTWKGNMSAVEQRALFGRFLGKGMIVIDGNTETLKHIKKVCFGHDYDVTFEKKWSEL